jgi:hypothetical protein
VLEPEGVEDAVGEQLGIAVAGDGLDDADQELVADIRVAGLLPAGGEVRRCEVGLVLLAGYPHHVVEVPAPVLPGSEQLEEARALTGLLEVIGKSRGVAGEVADDDVAGAVDALEHVQSGGDRLG